MSFKLLAIDLGKRSFHVYGMDSDEVVVSRKVNHCKIRPHQTVGQKTALAGWLRLH